MTPEPPAVSPDGRLTYYQTRRDRCTCVDPLHGTGDGAFVFDWTP